MKHLVSPEATIEYDRDENEWVGKAGDGKASFEWRSVELTQVMFDMEDAGFFTPQSYEWSNRNGVEQVLVVVEGTTEEP